MRAALWFLAGATVATVVVTRLVPASETSCCHRVAIAARDRIASKTGPLASLTSGLLDGLGLTNHLPSLLDTFGA